MGLYISHCFIPPTPGPIAAANTLFGVGGLGTDVNLLLVMAIGAVCSILPLIAGYIFALFIGKKVKAKDEPTNARPSDRPTRSWWPATASSPARSCPSPPIVVPIILMGVASAFSMAGSNPAIIVFLGKPIIALAVGLILGVILMAQSGKMGEFYALTDDTLKTVGPILFVTAAGGVLGKVIATTDLVNFITAHAATLESWACSSRSCWPPSSRRRRAVRRLPSPPARALSLR